MSLFSSKQNDELVFILDIQSSLVRGSLVLLSTSGKARPKIVFSYEKEIPYRKNGSSGYLIKSALQGVSEVLSDTLRYLSIHAKAEGLPHKIHSVHYALSSPWVISQARTIENKFQKETTISRNLVLSMIEKQRAALVPDKSDRIMTIEEKIFDVRLNGYSVGAWQNRMAKDVDISFVMSAAGTVMINKFRQIVDHAVPGRRVHFHSSLLLQTIGIRLVMPDKDAYTLIHVHGELTDIVVVDRSSCVFFGSYPTGIRTILRKLAKATNTDFQAADSLLALYVSKHLDPAKEKAISGVMDDLANGWNGEYNRLFKVEAAPMPSVNHPAIIFCRNHEEFFLDCFASAHPGAQVGPLSLDLIEPRVTYLPNVDRMRVTGLQAVALSSLKI